MKILRKLLSKARFVFRSAITGKFVSQEYAEDHPDSTYKDRL